MTEYLLVAITMMAPQQPHPGTNQVVYEVRNTYPNSELCNADRAILMTKPENAHTGFTCMRRSTD